MSDWPYIPARWQPSRAGNPVIWVVLHTREAPLAAGTAASVGRYFQGVTQYASTHIGADPGAVVRYVEDVNGCYGAERNSNRRGWHIEQAGYAHFSTEWRTPEGQAMIGQAATAAAYACRRFGIPTRMLSDTELTRFTSGITSHAQITRAFRVAGGHTDPGTAYPFDDLVGRTRELLGQSRLAPVADPIRADNRFRAFPTLRVGSADEPAAVTRARLVGGPVLDVRAPVLTLQSTLNQVMDAKLTGDGMFGRFATAAVEHFQGWWRGNGLALDVDGICGPKTWSQLDIVADLQGRT